MFAGILSLVYRVSFDRMYRTFSGCVDLMQLCKDELDLYVRICGSLQFVMQNFVIQCMFTMDF
jgi:hypothetical protein